MRGDSGDAVAGSGMTGEGRGGSYRPLDGNDSDGDTLDMNESDLLGNSSYDCDENVAMVQDVVGKEEFTVEKIKAELRYAKGDVGQAIGALYDLA